jgi:hypothetical protein
MVSPQPWLEPNAARRASYSRDDSSRRPSGDDNVFAWMIQYEWLLFFGLILALAIADLVATRRAMRRSRESDASERHGPDPRD